MEKKYNLIKEFYPFYLTKHLNPTYRTLHFIGTSILLIVLLFIVTTKKWEALWLIPIIGYGFAWTVHYFFEKNNPATFKYPLYNLASDFIMFKDLLIGKQKKIKQKNK